MIDQLVYVAHDDCGLDTLIGRTRLRPREEVVLFPCIEVVWIGRSKQAPTFLRRPYEAFVEQWGGEVRFWCKTGARSFTKPRAATLSAFADELEKPASWDEGGHHCSIHAGSKVERLPPAFYLDASKIGDEPDTHWSVSMCLPASYSERAAEFWHELLKACTPADFESGWVGYAIVDNPAFADSLYQNEEAVARWAEWHRRYFGLLLPGVSVLPARVLDRTAREGIRTVGWMTLLGREFASEKGGPDAIRKALGADVRVRALGKGVCIQAGVRPELGDKKAPPAYVQVGRFLRDLRTGPTGYAAPIRSRLGRAFNRWLTRFETP